MPIGKKFGTNAVKQIWSITYFRSALDCQLKQLVIKKQSNYLRISVIVPCKLTGSILLLLCAIPT